VDYDKRSVFVNVPVSSTVIMSEIDPRQDEKWVEEQQKNNNE
jgi:hypothetical protein